MSKSNAVNEFSLASSCEIIVCFEVVECLEAWHGVGRPVASLPGGGGVVGGPKGDRVGWCGVCVWGGGYYYSEWSRGVVRSNPPTPPPPGYGPESVNIKNIFILKCSMHSRAISMARASAVKMELGDRSCVWWVLLLPRPSGVFRTASVEFVWGIYFLWRDIARGMWLVVCQISSTSSFHAINSPPWYDPGCCWGVKPQ